MMTVCLLLADTTKSARIAPRQLLDQSPGIPAMDKVRKCMELIKCLRSGEVALLLLHIDVPVSEGLDPLACVHTSVSKVPVLALDVECDSLSALLELEPGMGRSLAEDSELDTPLAAIPDRRDLGSRPKPRRAFDAPRIDISNCADHGILSARELHIMRLLAEGAGIGDIASRLALRNVTVSTYKTRLMRKMGFASIAHLIRYAIAHELA